MISKGVLVFSRDVSFINQSAIVTFTPTFAHAPQSEAIFFTLGSNGIILSKQITINLSQKLPNYVRNHILWLKN
jgi:hypothetical protein